MWSSSSSHLSSLSLFIFERGSGHKTMTLSAFAMSLSPLFMAERTVIDVVLDQTIMVITMEWFGKIMVIYYTPTRGEKLLAWLGFGLVLALFCIHNEQDCLPHFIYTSILQTRTINL